MFITILTKKLKLDKKLKKIKILSRLAYLAYVDYTIQNCNDKTLYITTIKSNDFLIFE